MALGWMVHVDVRCWVRHRADAGTRRPSEFLRETSHEHGISPDPDKRVPAVSASLHADRNCRGGFGVGELVAFLYAHSFPKDEWDKRVREALQRPGAQSR